MRKGMWSVAALVGLLLAAFPVAPGTVRAADTTVKMVDGSGDPTTTWKFEPATITIAAGSSVIWHNDGEQAHTATGDNFDTDYVNPGKDSKPIPFPSAGRFEYKCTPHPWMKAVIVVTGGGATNTPPSTTATTVPGATTTSSAPAPAGGTTTTTRAGAGGSGQSTTTTTAPAAGGVTSTTQAASTTPTSASENAGNSSGAATGGSAEEAGADHGSEEAAEKKNVKSSPIGIAFASVSTLLLAAIAGKLLASKP
jgi:plastocyanin